MNKEDEKELLQFIRELAENDIIIGTFLKIAEVDARMEMIGERVSKDFLDDTIIANGLKSMIKSIMSLQSERIQLLYEDLKDAHLKTPIILKMD
jgi:hypothetical protein